MDTFLDELLAELRAHAVAIEPILEGWHDYSRLNLTDSAKAIANQGIADYQRRKDLTNTAITALEALAGDLYPTKKRYLVSEVVEGDLTANSNTILAALGQVDGEEEVVSGEVEFTNPGT